ncbi:hydroxymethylglutaryl-CoA synthase, partial [Chloroflexota bacterium]
TPYILRRQIDMTGIIGYGVYVPRFRLKSEEAAMAWGGWAAGEKSVCGIDEDIVTMAAEASEKAMKHAGIDPSKIGAIHLGTASSPYIEQYVAPILAETLELGPETTMVDYCGSLNAGAMALQGCLDAIAAGRIGAGIVIVTEDRATHPGSAGEAGFGCGAAAFVIGTEGTIADIEGTEHYTTLFMDRWRATTDNFVSDFFDDRFDREYGYQKHIETACKGLIDRLGRGSSDYNHMALQQPDARLPGIIAKCLGIRGEMMASGSIAGMVGDLGSASAFVSLAGILDKAKAGERVLFASYGSGSSTAASLVVDGAIEGKRSRSIPLEKYIGRKEYINYLTYMKLADNIIRAPY